MKKSKAESLLLIAVLAFSIQTGSYSAALSNGELNQIYVENTAEARVTDTIITKYRTVNGKRQKGGGIKQKIDGKIQRGKICKNGFRKEKDVE